MIHKYKGIVDDCGCNLNLIKHSTKVFDIYKTYFQS
jgi:hypothetical protein